MQKHTARAWRSPRVTSPRRSIDIQPLERRLLLSAGQLDLSFGNGGSLPITFPGAQTTMTVVRDSVVQPDGKIVLVGEAPDAVNPTTGTDFAIARLTAGGRPDTTFATTGLVVIQRGTLDDEGTGVAVQADGKIVASAFFSDGSTSSVYGVLRFLPDGTLDSGFGTSGVRSINFTTTNASASYGFARDVLVSPVDGKILVIGDARPDPTVDASDFALARLNPDGSLDSTYGASGLALARVVQNEFSSETARAGALDANGNLVVTGGDGVFLTARFHPDGALDTTFGDNGSIQSAFNSAADNLDSSVANAIAIQPDGKIVVAGTAEHDDFHMYSQPAILFSGSALARYNADGTPDAVAFGSSMGQIEQSFAYFSSYNQVTIDSAGRIIAAGLYGTTGGRTFTAFGTAVTRFTLGTQFDPTFGNNGVAIIPASTASTGITLQTASIAGALATQSAVLTPVQEKLLAISPSGGAAGAANYLVATRLTGDSTAGADLAIDAVSGPTSVAIKAKSRASITIAVTNIGDAAITAPVKIALTLSTDDTADAGDHTLASRSFPGNLAAGASTTYVMKFAYPGRLPDGQYFLLAEASTAGDANAANNVGAAPQQLTMIAPFVDLGGSFNQPAAPLTPGKKATLLVTLTNAGTKTASSTIDVQLLASTDAIADASDVPLQVPKPVRTIVKASGSRVIRLTVRVPSTLPPGAYYLIATLTGPKLDDANPANNTFTTEGRVTVM